MAMGYIIMRMVTNMKVNFWMEKKKEKENIFGRIQTDMLVHLKSKNKKKFNK